MESDTNQNQEVKYSLLSKDQVLSPLMKGVFEVHAKNFGRTDADGLIEEINRKFEVTILVAQLGDAVVGYKIGYERKPQHYYSWIGGVAAEARGRGIATELIRRQQEWCRAKGYRSIRTTSKNKWRDMMALNLRHGFDIIGCFVDGHGDPKIMMEKRLR